MNGQADMDSDTYVMSSHSEIRVTDPLQTELTDPLAIVSVKTEDEDDDMEHNLKVVEVVEQLEVNIIVEDHGTYLQDMNGVKLYFLGANGMELQPLICQQEYCPSQNTIIRPEDIKQEEFVAVDVCSECGGELNTSMKEGPVCVKCTVGSSPSPKVSVPNIYKKHYLNKSLRKNHVCSTCKKEFRRFIDLKDHSCSPEDKSTREKQKTEITKNKTETSQDHSYCCDTCKKIFYNLYTLERHCKIHIRKEAPKKTNVCIICSKKYRTNSVLEEHYSTHEEVKKSIKCSFCPQYLTSKKELVVHSIAHNMMKRPFKCKGCPAVFPNIARLRSHTYIHLKEKAFPCSVCNKSFSQLQQVKSHEYSHQSFTCKDCKREFKRSGHFKRHYCPLRKRLFRENEIRDQPQ
ncbi:zinc finger protein 25-like [Periplaneta americana]|uniref:zinc finger protein 25-like n=1 Tax=Periplaneta americana TaxID=6978 RepID=UPI0037E83DDB